MASSMRDDPLDRSQSDYYCTVCDAHMNSIQMWESHISGKRHAKNQKKPLGEGPSKVKSVRVDHVAELHEELKKHVDRGPIVGLSYICELQKAKLAPTYTCYLCAAQVIKSMIVEHIFCLKHCMNYLKEVCPDVHENIMNLKLSKPMVEQLVLKECEKLEKEEGSGTVEVKVEKDKFGMSSHSPRFGSSSSRNSEAGTSGVDPDLMPSPDKGIREIDLFGDNLSMDIVVDIIYNRYMHGPPPPMETPEQIQRLWHVIQLFETAVANYEIRQLSKEDQQKLLNKVMYVDQSKRPLVKLIGLNGLK